MDIKRLQEGTKVKLIEPLYHLPKGTIGYVYTATSYHRGGVLDKDGDLWVKFTNSAYCLLLKDVKVLCYCPKKNINMEV